MFFGNFLILGKSENLKDSFLVLSSSQALVAPHTPQGVLVRGHAGLEINKLSFPHHCSVEGENIIDVHVQHTIGSNATDLLYRGTSLIRNSPPPRTTIGT